MSTRGFTLLEALIIVAVIGVLSAVAVPIYVNHVNRARANQALVDISVIELLIMRFRSEFFGLPDTLDQLGKDVPTDPWGNAYQYQRIEGAGLKGKGKLRKDKKLNPINIDYDLYSMGEDGHSKLPLTAKQSWDDIIRASNGAYVGPASEY